MNIRKQLIKLNNKLESTWRIIDFSTPRPKIYKGWYVTEFLLQGSLDHIPRLIIHKANGKSQERVLVGSHAGRNRMLVYLVDGELSAHSKSIEFERLARVSTLEGRARVLLICARYLRDFFSIKVVFKMLLMQFQDNIELSSNLLHFYAPARGGDAYLEQIDGWQKFHGFGKQLAWLGHGVTIAVIIEHEGQRQDLSDLLVAPDAILMAGEPVPSNIDYLIPLNATEKLRAPAILMLKRAIKKTAVRPSLVYTDHDYQLTENKPISGLEPVFKPQPSHAYLHCFNYIGFAVVFSVESVSGHNTQELMTDELKYRIALQAFESTSSVLGVSEALFNSSRKEGLTTPEPSNADSAWPNIAWQRRTNYNALVANEAWQDHPSIDLVIPTRDGLAVLKPCVDSILTKTSYKHYKIIIVDNGSELAETHAYFAELKHDDRVSIVEYPGEFNYSAINNFAASTGSSDYIGLINNDIEVIDGDWLTQMMVWAVQPSVGIVGAKLLFGNGKVQHAGVTIGMGNAAGHIHRLEEGDAPGYQLRCLATQNMMAVTAACLLTPRALFESIGGLDEENFKVAYNDIDYCLKVEALGREIIWTPEARLFHHESVSRGDDMSEQHIERYFTELEALQSRWKCKGFVDKYYSKHLRITDEGVFPQLEHRKEGELIHL